MDDSEGKKVVENHIEILEKNWTEFEKYFEYIQSLEAKNHIKETLLNYYGKNQLATISYKGKDYPVLSFLTASYNEPLAPDSLRGPLQLRPNEDVHREGLSRAVCEHLYNKADTPSDISKNADQYLRTGCGYNLTNIPMNESELFDFELTNYSTIISQKKQLYYELFDKLYAHNELQASENNSLEYSFQYRGSVAGTQSMCTDLTTNKRFLTFTVLPLFKTDDSYVFPIATYKKNSFLYPQFKSTLPEASFNYRRKPNDEFEFKYSIYEAFASQLFSHQPNLNDLFNHTALSELQELEKDEKAELKAVGVSTNPLDVTHSLLTYLKIDDPSYLNSFVFECYNDVESYELIDITDSTRIQQLLSDASVLPQTKLAISQTLNSF